MKTIMSLVLSIDDFDLPEFCNIARDFGVTKFGYVVTANTDHLIRYSEDERFRKLYADASYVLLDSQFLSYLLRLFRGVKFKVCPGSDLTARIFSQVILPEDSVVLFGATPEQAQTLKSRFHLRRFQHINPKMGFINDAAAVQQCLAQIEAASPFRYCFLAVGSPQQEIIAAQLRERGIARGLALCVGASIDFMTGAERRAPPWLRRIGCEWLYRLLQNPGRLAHRYLVRGPRIFMLLPLFNMRSR